MHIHKYLLALLLSALMVATAQAEALQSGRDYQRVDPPVSIDGDQITVVELFWYGCPACYNMEPHIDRWLENKPENVKFVRLPAIFSNPAWELHARAYYTAKDLGVMEQFHEPFFHAIHRFNQPMQNEAQIRRFFEQIGVSGEDFDKSFKSFAVQTQVRRAADLTRRYGIDSVPSMAINGRYVVTGPMAGTYENLFATINTLAEQEGERLANR